MKIYVASSFVLIPLVEKVVKSLENNGHEITVKWWSRVYTQGNGQLVETLELKKQYSALEPDVFYDKPETRASYLADLRGIEEAEAFVLVAQDKAHFFTGALVELGYAVGCGLLCLSLGTLKNSVMYHDVIRCKNMEELLKWLSP